jgi:signal transduction histidine kinase
MKRISLLPVGSDVFGKLLCLAFAAVVGSFLVTNFIVQRSSTAVDALSEGIIYNSAPSIEHLASIRREALEAELILSRFIHEPTHRSELEGDLEETLTRVKEGTREYLTLAPLPGEQSVRMDVHEAWLHFDKAVRQAREAVGSNADAEASALLDEAVEPTGRRILEAVTLAIEHNAARGRDIAESIRDSRYRTMLLANGLNAICGVLAVGVAWLLHREARARRALFDAHTRSLEARAAELEQFAGRVAHDIRNPLFAARMAAEIALRKDPEAVQAPVHRIIRSLSRADEITGALLDFARSGAKPDPGARTEPRTVIADLLGGFEEEVEQAGISLHCEHVPPVLVACSTGVYLSLLGNLVRNAIKYMGDAEVRRITLRVAEQGGFIRTEVRDTGPGIAPESLALLFEPYFRGKGVSTEGLGLGLATVKKLAESHGGQVGVASERGSGSTFWFELQRAGSARELSTTGDDAPPPRQQAAQH